MPRVDGIVTLSRRVRDIQRALHPDLLALPTWIIPPAYSAAAHWTWRKGLARMMQSRPATRSSIDSALVRQTIDLLRARDLDLKIYGQDTSGGFIDAAAKAVLQGACSSVMSARCLHGPVSALLSTNAWRLAFQSPGSLGVI